MQSPTYVEIMFDFAHCYDKLLIETLACFQYNHFQNKNQHLFMIVQTTYFDNKEEHMKYTKKIDFQAHYLPPAYYEFLEKQGLYNPDGFPTPEWDLDTQREAMETLGIDFALLTISSPSVYHPDKIYCRETARKINEQGAQYAAQDPAHLGFAATLPLPHIHSSIYEIRYALDELHADAVGLMTNYNGIYLGDRRYDEVMQELDDRAALVILHPTQPAVMVPNVNEELSVPAFEYFVETTRTFTNMVLHDTFDRFPNIKWVIPHAGAFLPILADRFESFALMIRFADPDRRADMMEDMAHVYFDVAGFSEQKQLEMLLRNVPDTHLVYGSDTPYTAIEACIGQTEALENTAKLTEEQKVKMFTENAWALLPRLKK